MTKLLLLPVSILTYTSSSAYCIGVPDFITVGKLTAELCELHRPTNYIHQIE